MAFEVKHWRLPISCWYLFPRVCESPTDEAVRSSAQQEVTTVVGKNTYAPSADNEGGGVLLYEETQADPGLQRGELV